MQKKEGKLYLLNQLRKIQEKHNSLPEKEIRALSKKTNIPVIKIYEAATFYTQFNIEKKGKNTIRICNSPSCYLNGSLNIINEAKKLLKVDLNQTTKNKKFSLELTSCIGCCNNPPALMLNDELITNITKPLLKKILK